MIISKILKISLKFFLSFFAGVLLLIFFIKNDPLVRQEVGKKLNPFFSYMLSHDITYSLKDIQLFPFRLTLKNPQVFSKHNGDWQWRAKRLVVGCSWLDFLLYGTISLHLELHDLDVRSRLNENGLCAWEHICGMYEGEVYIPTFLQTLKVKNAYLSAVEQSTGARVMVDFSLDAKTIGNAFKGAIRFSDGDFFIQNKKLFECLRGPVRFDLIGQVGSPQLLISTNCSVSISQMDEKKECHVVGSWRYDHGLFSLKNDDRSFVVGPVKLYTVGNILSLESVSFFPAAYLYRIFSEEKNSSPSGNCVLKTNIEFGSASPLVRGELLMGKLFYGKNMITEAGSISFNRRNDIWRGNAYLAFSEDKKFTGSFIWQEKKGTGTLDIKNKTTISIPSFSKWTILPTHLNTQVMYKKDGVIEGKFNSIAKNEKIDSEFKCNALGTWSNKLISVEGSIGDNPFCFECSADDRFCIKKCFYCSQSGDHLVNIKAHEESPDKFVGTVSFPFVQKCLSKMYGFNLHGEGTIKLYGTVKDGKLFSQITVVNGNIRLPYTYNFLHSLRARFVLDPTFQSFIAQDVICLLHRGKALCKRAVVQFDENYGVSFVHAPVLFEDCLLTWKKDFFAVVSGYLTFKKQKEKAALLKGRLCVDRAQLKQNIFSSDFQNTFFAAPGNMFDQQEGCIFDVRVKTKEAIRVKTSFLQTSAHVNLLFSGTVFKPDLSGSISFTSGSLEFPYRPLHITSGVIEFLPGQFDDPLIEIIAKNKLKKYNVDLHVSGSLQQQQIMLESSPALSEQQIISLLLAGSEKESLNILMPALIMQNIKGIIFGSNQSPTGIRSAFGRLFKPLERIHIVPSFTDQTGRGGLRGAVEIEVSERWRAMIQKNFSLTEDTRFEAEYLLSDDVSLRGVRDERGDMSAEVEMRWKF